MASPDSELQAALANRLRSFAALTALVEQRTYDLPPADARLPYVTIGEAQAMRADASCVDGQDVYLTLHAWSTYSGGFKEVKEVAGAVVDALHLQPLTLATHRLVSILHRQTRTFRDRDGVTSHAVIEFVASTERL